MPGTTKWEKGKYEIMMKKSQYPRKGRQVQQTKMRKGSQEKQKQIGNSQ